MNFYQQLVHNKRLDRKLLANMTVCTSAIQMNSQDNLSGTGVCTTMVAWGGEGCGTALAVNTLFRQYRITYTLDREHDTLLHSIR